LSTLSVIGAGVLACMLIGASLLWIVLSIVIPIVAYAFYFRFRVLQSDHATKDLLKSSVDAKHAIHLVPKTLIMSRTGDEADGLLKIASFVNSWLAVTLRQTSLIQNVIGFYERSAPIVAPEFDFRNAFDDIESFQAVANQAVATDRKIVLEALWPRLRQSGDLRLFILLWKVVFPYKPTLLIDAIIAVSATAILRVMQFAVGTRSGFVSVAALVTSSETPPGVWHHYQSTASATPRSTLLSHSQIYDDEAVLAYVGAWVAREQGA
jgi:hypothetical protein